VNMALAIASRYRRVSLVGYLLCGLLLGAQCSVAQVSPGAPNVSPAPGKSAPIDTLTLAATNVGIKRCLPAISRLSSLVVSGSTGNDVLVDWDRKNADASPFFSLSGVEYKNASLAFSLTAVPDSQGGCSVAAERISVAPFTCNSIAQQELAGYNTTRLLATFTVYVNPKDPGASVSLIDSPPGCLIIRRHVEFDWKDPALKATGR
jgi:hypothetical protein